MRYLWAVKKNHNILREREEEYGRGGQIKVDMVHDQLKRLS